MNPNEAEPILNERADATTLALSRIVVFSMCLAHVAGGRFELYASMPRSLFNAPGLLAHLSVPALDVLLTEAGLQVVRTVLLVLLLLAVIGVHPWKLVAPVCVLLLMLYDGIEKGYGAFVNHAQLGILLAAGWLAISPAADALSVVKPFATVKKSIGIYSSAMLIIASLLTTSYSLLGAKRIFDGGYQIFAGDALPTYIALRTFEYNPYGFSFGYWVLEHPTLTVLCKVSFAWITIAELTSPFVLSSRLFRLVWLGTMIPFHLLTLVTMNIFFWENLVLIVVFLSPFLERIQRLRPANA